MSFSPDISQDTDALAAMLADPEIRQSLAVIVANAPTLAALASMGSAFLQRGPEIADNVNGLIEQMRSEGEAGTGGSLSKVVPLATSLANRTDSIIGVIDSAVLAPEVVEVIGRIGEAAAAADVATRGKNAQVGGIMAILRQLKDPQVQETLAFLFEFARIFGNRQAAAK